MKKIVFLLLILLLVLSACAVQPQENSAPTETTAPTQPTESLTQPTEPPTQPTEPPNQPTEPTTPQLADSVEIKNYRVESAYIDVLNIYGLTSIETGKFHASLQSLTENLDFHKEHDFFKSTAQFDGLYAKATEIDFTKNYVVVVYFPGLAESKPEIERISLVEEPPLNGERLFGLHVEVKCDKGYKQFMSTDVTKIKYHFLMITIPKTEIQLDGILPHDAGVTVREPPTEPPTQPTEPTYKDDDMVISRQEVTDYSIKMAYCDIYAEEIVANMWCGQLFETADGLSKFINARCNTPELSTKVKNDICPQTFEEVGAALLAETNFAVNNVAVFYVLGTPDALPDITKVEYVDYILYSDMNTVKSVKSFMISLTNFGAVVGDLSQVKYYQVFVTVPKTYEIPKTQPEYPFVPTFLNRVSK